MKTEIKADATITLTLGKQKIDLTLADAKKLLAQLQTLAGEPPVRIEYIRNDPPYRDPFPPVPQWPHWPEVICQTCEIDPNVPRMQLVG